MSLGMTGTSGRRPSRAPDISRRGALVAGALLPGIPPAELLRRVNVRKEPGAPGKMKTRARAAGARVFGETIYTAAERYATSRAASA